MSGTDQASEGTGMRVDYSISEARPRLSPLLDEVQQGKVAVIERRGFKALVTALDAEEALLARCYGFKPEVSFSPSGAVVIWLPELALHAQGASLEAAESDLVDAAIDYAEDWQSFLKNAPNHAERAGWVQRLKIAGEPAQVRRVLFGS
jgi:hypothetical protein